MFPGLLPNPKTLFSHFLSPPVLLLFFVYFFENMPIALLAHGAGDSMLSVERIICSSAMTSSKPSRSRWVFVFKRPSSGISLSKLSRYAPVFTYPPLKNNNLPILDSLPFLLKNQPAGFAKIYRNILMQGCSPLPH